ncbi:GNAT family N-acetyltransferase [Chloroflexota bacterium]
MFEFSDGITGEKVRLREKGLSDARNDYTWQADPELARLDATQLLTTSFPKYLLDYTDQLRHSSPSRHLFAIETLDGKHIGNCTCYDINEAMSEVELGIMIGDRNCWDKGYGTDAVMVIVNYIFLQTNLRRIYLKTLDWNLRAQRCFQKCGFIPCGHLSRNGYDFVRMELHRKQWAERQEQD